MSSPSPSMEESAGRLERIRLAVKPWIDRFLSLSAPTRFFITAAVSMLGSAGAVAGVTKLGANWFVLYYGVRIPADGLPYVTETAAAMSVVILFGAALAYLIGYLIIAVLTTLVTPTEGPRWAMRIDRWIWVGYVAFARVGFVVILLLSLLQIATSDRELNLSTVAYSLMFLAANLHISFGAATGAILLSLMTVLTSFLLWVPPVYGWFLRTIGHGGGRFCTVYLDDASPPKIDGYLVVRTGTALLMFDGHDKTVEIPLATVRRIEQPTQLYWCLPGNCIPTAPP